MVKPILKPKKCRKFCQVNNPLHTKLFKGLLFLWLQIGLCYNFPRVPKSVSVFSPDANCLYGGNYKSQESTRKFFVQNPTGKQALLQIETELKKLNQLPGCSDRGQGSLNPLPPFSLNYYNLFFKSLFGVFFKTWIQWGSEYRLFEYQKRLNTKLLKFRFQMVPYSNGGSMGPFVRYSNGIWKPDHLASNIFSTIRISD